MNFIKTYLLPLVLLLFINASLFAQDGSHNKDSKLVLSKTDSIIVHHYYTEKDYLKNQNISESKNNNDSDNYYEDEIYSNKKYHKKNKSNFWKDVSVELVADVVVNSLLFIAIIWD
ncbi:MAG: hypothetical protein ACPGSL_03540 [Vicingaceae bacterium]